MVATLKPRETEVQVWSRMLAIAQERDLAFATIQLDDSEDVLFLVESHSRGGEVHICDTHYCSCQGFARTGHCTHTAIVRHALGLIPSVGERIVRRMANLENHLGATLDVADGDYPTPAEYRALVAMAKRRGVQIVGLNTTKPYAEDPTRGRCHLTIETCSCKLGMQGVMCQHLALFVEQLAEQADATAIAA